MVVVVGVISLAVPAAHAAGTPPGALDASYGDKGIAVVDLPKFDYARASAVQSDGKLVLAGESEGVLTVVRFATTGRLDGSFGDGGIVRLARRYSGAAAVQIARDGSIFVAGTSQRTPHRSNINEVNYAIGAVVDGSRLLIAKLTPRGTLDRSFGRGGLAETQSDALHPLDEAAVDMVLTPAGAIVVLAITGQSAGYYGYPAAVVLRQFTPAGLVDTAFGVQGVAVAGTPSAVPIPAGLEVQKDGRLIVGATFVEPWFVPFMPPSSDMMVSRYLPTGQLDPTYGIGGVARHDLGGSDWMRGITLDPNDRVVVFADMTETLDRLLLRGDDPSPPWHLLVMRLNSIGYRDDSFGDTGVTFMEDPPRMLVFMEGGAVQRDGRVVVVTYADPGKIRLQRLGANGKPDLSFERNSVPLAGVTSLAFAGSRVLATGTLNNNTGGIAAAAYAS